MFKFIGLSGYSNNTIEDYNLSSIIFGPKNIDPTGKWRVFDIEYDVYKSKLKAYPSKIDLPDDLIKYFIHRDLFNEY